MLYKVNPYIAHPRKDLMRRNLRDLCSREVVIVDIDHKKLVPYDDGLYAWITKDLIHVPMILNADDYYVHIDALDPWLDYLGVFNAL